MKHIRRLLFFTVIIFLFLLYRDELNGIIVDITKIQNKSTIEDAAWGEQRRKAYEAYEFKNVDVDEVVDLLEQYLETVTRELHRHDAGQEGLVTSRHDIHCELSVVHNKLKHTYYRISDIDKFYHHETLYRQYLSQCAHNEEATDGYDDK